MNLSLLLLRITSKSISPRKTGLFLSLALGLLLGPAGCANDQASGVALLSHGINTRGANATALAAPGADATPLAASSILARVGFLPVSYETGGKDQGPEVLPPPTSQQGSKPGTSSASAAPTAHWSLDETIRQVLMADPKLRANLENIREAEGDFWQSKLLPNPTLNWDFTMMPLNQRFNADRPGGPPQMDTWIGYPLDWFVFGKRAAAMASAAQGVNGSQFDYSDQIRQRVTAAALAFYDVLEAKALVVLARQDVDNLKKVEKAIADAVDAGQRPTVDLYRIQLDRLKSEQTLREAGSTLTVNLAKLRAFLGGAAAGLALDVAGTLDVAVTDVPVAAEGAYDLAVQNRPDVQSLRSKIAKAEADVRVENRNAFPDLAAKFGYTHQNDGDQGKLNADSWNVEVDMSLPILNRNQGKRLKARAVVAEMNYNLQAGLLDLRAEVEQAVVEMHTAYLNTQAVGQDQLKLANQVRESIEQAVFKAGTQPLVNLLDAERTYRETYRLYINTRANYWRSVHRFNSAIGKQVLK